MNQFEKYSYTSKIWKVILILSLLIVILGIMISLLWMPNYKLSVKILETDEIQNSRMLKVKETQEIFKNVKFTYNISYIEIDRNDTNSIRIYKSANNEFYIGHSVTPNA